MQPSSHRSGLSVQEIITATILGLVTMLIRDLYSNCLKCSWSGAPCYKLVYSYSNYCMVVMAITPLQKQPGRFFCRTSLKNPLAQSLVFVAQNLVFVPPESCLFTPLTIVTSTNYTYICWDGYVYQLSYPTGAPPCINIHWTTIITMVY